MIMLSIIGVIFLVGLDQWTKFNARKKLGNDSLDYGFFKLSLVKNKGAFRGLLKKHPLVLVSVQTFGVIIVGTLFVIQLIGKKDKLLVVGLGLLLAGAIGNLIDRFLNKYVTDFFAIKWTKNLYYNLADMFIFIGAIITMLREKQL